MLERELQDRIKIKFALEREEIVDYDPDLNMFEFFDRTKIDADSYMSPTFKEFRDTKESHAKRSTYAIYKRKELHEAAFDAAQAAAASDDPVNMVSEADWQSEEEDTKTKGGAQ